MENLALPQQWQERAQNSDFKEATLIQAKTFQPLKEKENLLAIAPTGTGKTLAYLLPCLLNVKKQAGNQLLILTPSQELGIQVAQVAQNWASDLDLKVQPLIGGANKKRQIEKLKQKPEVLVATPGRVAELIKLKKVKAANIKTVVLDEADQLLQKETAGFVQAILKAVPKTSQYAFFSATGEKAVSPVEKIFGSIDIVDVSQEDNSNQQVKHYYLLYPKRRKVDVLRRLANLDDFQALFFFNEVQDLGNAEEKLIYHQLAVASLASDQNKMMRKAALEKFRSHELAGLLTTDLASRGLDINDLYYVINTEVPQTKESYLHRAGRVGRMGKKGAVVTIVQENTLPDLKRMMKQLDLSLQEIYLHGGELTTVQPIVAKQTPKKKKNKNKGSRKKKKS